MSLLTNFALCPTWRAPESGVTVYDIRQEFPVLYLLLSPCNKTTGRTPVGGTAIMFSGKAHTVKL